MFDRTFVVNLDRRPDRWEAFQQRFPADWPFAPPERWPAVDGKTCEVPGWFGAGPGAWGCLRTHVAIWWAQVEHEWDSVLVLEDDAVFCRDVVDIMRRTIEVLPDDWEQLYFGGQHLDTNERAPEVVIQDKLIRCRYTNRTHAYAIRQGFACEAIDVVDCPNERHPPAQHVDYLLGDLQDEHRVYAPWRFCIGQVRGKSDVRHGKYVREHWWNQFPIVPARELAGVG
jgi:hypothetical protein